MPERRPLTCAMLLAALAAAACGTVVDLNPGEKSFEVLRGVRRIYVEPGDVTASQKDAQRSERNRVLVTNALRDALPECQYVDARVNADLVIMYSQTNQAITDEGLVPTDWTSVGTILRSSPQRSFETVGFVTVQSGKLVPHPEERFAREFAKLYRKFNRTPD